MLSLSSDDFGGISDTYGLSRMLELYGANFVNFMLIIACALCKFFEIHANYR